MKCSICNAENPDDATSCHQCGFGLSLSQPAWPEFPTVEIPEPSAGIEWPDLSETASPLVPSAPAWPADDILTPSVEPVEIEPIAVEIEKPKLFPARVPPAAPPTKDDRLARAHIASGFKAIRKELYEQAKWEFEQARDLTDNPGITHMAQAQLGELANRAIQAAQPRPTPPRRVRPIQPTRPKKSLPPITSAQTRPPDWGPAVRTGLIVGVVSGVLGLVGLNCIGFLLPSLSGYIAGWWMARDDVPDRYGQLSTTTSAAVAGGIAGFIGWMGQMIGHPVWRTITSTTQSDSNIMSALGVCMTGVFYIPLAAVLGTLGWQRGKKKT